MTTFYNLYQYHRICYSSTDAQYAIHELLNIVYERMHINVNNFDDLYIEVCIDTKSQFPYIINRYIYGHGALGSIFVGPQDEIHNLSEPNKRMFSQIMHFTPCKQTYGYNNKYYSRAPPQSTQQVQQVQQVQKPVTKEIKQNVLDNINRQRKIPFTPVEKVTPLTREDKDKLHETYIANNDKESTDCPEDINLIEQEIELYKKLKQDEENKLQQALESHKEDQSNLTDYVCEENYKKKQLFKQQEAATERYNVFLASQNSYIHMCQNHKEDILNSNIPLTNISELFVEKYKVLKFMFKTDLINATNAFDIYSALLEFEHTTDINDNYESIINDYIISTNAILPMSTYLEQLDNAEKENNKEDKCAEEFNYENVSAV